jgi:hypothetical protein
LSAIAAFGQQVHVTELPDYQGQPSYKIETPAATWVYHKQGAGFASLLDRGGADWISYRAGGRAAGEFRGIPNLIHPGAGFHPGGVICDSNAKPLGADRARIESTCENGVWAAGWDIHPEFARFTLMKAPRPYWFLYEGTPGGKLDLDHGFWLLSDGTKGAVTESFGKDLPDPEWIAFGDDRSPRLLVIAKEEPDDALDQFYQMDGVMTVFGFGREHRCCGKFLTAVPARFVVMFVETADPAAINERLRALPRSP